MIFKIATRIKKRDAILLYAFHVERKIRSLDAATSFERIAVAMNDANCRTARGFAFTGAVVRSCVAELERAGVARREETEPGFFKLTLIEPDDDADRDDADVAAPEPKTRENAPLERRGRNVETREARSSARKKINIKINKQINKSVSRSNWKEDSRPTVDDAVAEVDLAEPRAVAARNSLLRELYEPGLHADLFDRAICALAKRLVTASELKAAIRLAREEKRLGETTNGFRGAKTHWQTFCLSVKSWFDAAGYRWTPTSFRREPRPTFTRRVPIVAD